MNISSEIPVVFPPLPTTFIKKFLKSTILSNPADSHTKILTYLSNSKKGLSERHSLIFKQCWSKCILANQAFGRGDKGLNNAEKFSDDLCRELVYGDNDISNLINYTANITNGHEYGSFIQKRKQDLISESFGPEELKRTKELVASLESFSTMAYKLATLISTINQLSIEETNTNSHTFQRLNDNVHSLQATFLLRHSLKDLKSSSQSSLKGATIASYSFAQYHPLQQN